KRIRPAFRAWGIRECRPWFKGSSAAMRIGLSRVSLWVGSQQRRNVAYSLHQIGLTVSAELSDHGLALLPITDRNLDLDQLMIIE
mgnify:CR=1